MEFKARAPREGINVSPTHPLKEAATLVAGLALLLGALLVFVTWSVDILVHFIPPEAEARAFASIDLDPLVDEIGELMDEQSAAVQGVLDQLLVHWPTAAYDFKVLVLSSDEPNAAAVPGGYIIVTSGLVEEAESENELAFVLGHELGHFRNRDHLRRLGRGVVYGLALSLVLGSSGSVPNVGTLMGEMGSRGFDRQQEREADRFGLSLVEARYGHVGASWQFFQRLSESSSRLDEWVAYLSTHPASESRIREMREYAETKGWALEGPTEPF